MVRSLHAVRSTCLAVSAFALTAPQVAFSQPTVDPDTAKAEYAGVADIVVTAQRREENLQRAALAISAVSGDSLARASVTDVTSLTKLVPSLIVQPATGTSVGFYLRGVGSLVGNAFTENPIAFNYNQVYIARPAALLGTFYDLQRVEVLKGPQGTLYGRNATGGAINVIPNRPVLGRAGMDLSLDGGSYNMVRAQAAANVPVGDTAAIRLAGQVATRDGYLSDGYDDENGQALRASVLIEPSAAFSVLIVGDYFHQGGRGPGGVLVPGALSPLAPPVSDRIGGADPRSIAALTAAFPFQINNGIVAPPKTNGFVNSNFYGLTADIGVDLGFAKLNVIGGYRDSRPNYLGYNGGYYARVQERAKQRTIEARLSSPGTGRFNYVIGAYYFDEDQRSFNNFIQGLAVNTLFQANLTNRSAAVFGQANFAIAPTLRIVAGARYTKETKINATTLTQTSFGVGPTTNITGRAEFDKFTYKAGVEWDIGPRNLFYANVATGFKSGGFFVAAFDNTFRPESITAYTVGSKNRFLDNRLQLNLEGFYWDYKDQQVNYIGPGRTSATTIGTVLATANAGKSRIYGAEAEMDFQLTRRDRFMANIQYLNGKYESFSYIAASATGAPPRTNCAISPSNAFTLPGAGRVFTINCSGKPQINSPEWSVNLGYEHRFSLSGDYDLTAGGRTRIESNRFLSPEYLPEERQNAYRQSDLFLTLANPAERWSITGYVNNVEDRTLYAGTSVRPVIPVVYNILRAPRTFGVRAGFSF
jgi:iron complex outermembrane recepter protein